MSSVIRELHDRIERGARRLQHLLEHAPVARSGEAVEDDPWSRPPAQSLVDHLDHHAVGTYSPRSMNVRARIPSGCPLDGLAEVVARGDLRDPEVLGQDAACALACARQSEEDEPHRVRPCPLAEEALVVGIISCDSISFHRLERTPTAIRIDVPPNGT
jgi:hypothetical protein